MPKLTKKAGMVNRQAVGTYQGKLHSRSSGRYGAGKNAKGKRLPTQTPDTSIAQVLGVDGDGTIDNIQCDGEVVAIDSLVPDPLNARLHPERNLEAIKQSLALYGQRSPLVVREQDRMIAAGNGRLEAMKALGWTRCAASVRPMTDAEYTGYALADNRTAELARWDFEVVARLDALMAERGRSCMVGWSDQELLALRAGAQPPGEFPEVDSDLPVESVCPRCGYQFSGGEKKKPLPAGEGL